MAEAPPLSPLERDRKQLTNQMPSNAVAQLENRALCRASLAAPQGADKKLRTLAIKDAQKGVSLAVPARIFLP